MIPILIVTSVLVSALAGQTPAGQEAENPKSCPVLVTLQQEDRICQGLLVRNQTVIASQACALNTVDEITVKIINGSATVDKVARKGDVLKLHLSHPFDTSKCNSFLNISSKSPPVGNKTLIVGFANVRKGPAGNITIASRIVLESSQCGDPQSTYICINGTGLNGNVMLTTTGFAGLKLEDTFDSKPSKYINLTAYKIWIDAEFPDGPTLGQLILSEVGSVVSAVNSLFSPFL